MKNDFKDYFDRLSDEKVRVQIQREQGRLLYEDYFDRNVRLMQKRFPRLMFSIRMGLILSLTWLINFRYSDLRHFIGLNFSIWFDLLMVSISMVFILIFTVFLILSVIHLFVDWFPSTLEHFLNQKVWFWLPIAVVDSILKNGLNIISFVLGCSVVMVIFIVG